MGLLNRIFRPDAKGAETGPPSATRFQDSDSGTEDDQAARLNVRRELVQVTLRETMRRHAVPSDWLDLRMLPVVNRKGKHGMHVQLVVKQGQGALLTYIPSFQSAFMAEIEKFEPRAWDWLLSISWQFTGISSTNAGEEPRVVTQPTPLAQAPARPQAAATPVDEDVEQDLQALFAIRDAAMQQSQEPQPDFQPTRPLR